MKKVIIGIHGLANKPEKDLLERWWRDSMEEGFKIHGIDKNLPAFELVYWADIIYDKPLDPFERDKENEYYLDEPYTKSPGENSEEEHPLRQKFNDYISEKLNKIFLNEDRSLNYEFVTDMLLSRYFNDLELYYRDGDDINRVASDIQTKKIRERIRERVVQVVRKYKGYEICIAAHSMGSIIAYDVLSYLLPDVKIKALITIGSPLGLPIVTAKIAEEHKLWGIDHSVLKTPPGVVGGWFNLADLKDPVAINYRLSDDFAPNSFGVAPVDFVVKNDYQINGTKNPHKSFGYLRSVEFSGIMSEFIGVKPLSLLQKLFKNVKGILKKGPDLKVI
ncbi:MAG: hypothetical protein AB9922_08320 [Bacteroidales bacterium]